LLIVFFNTVLVILQSNNVLLGLIAETYFIFSALKIGVKKIESYIKHFLLSQLHGFFKKQFLSNHLIFNCP